MCKWHSLDRILKFTNAFKKNYTASILLKLNHHTTHHNRFTALFPGPPEWAGARRKPLDFVLQVKINRGRHTDHAAGCHSIRTKQCPPPSSSMFFYRPDAHPAAQPTVSKHWRQKNFFLNLKLEMWANAQCDGRPPEYRWHPLFNAAVWLTPTSRVPCSNAAKTRNPLKFAGVPQTNETISATSGPKFTIL